MSEKDNNTPNEEKVMDRRKFIKSSGLVAGGVVGGSLFGGVLTNMFMKEDEQEDAPAVANYFEARMFFERKQDFDIMANATERIYPKSEAGPGAIELGVPYFIDRELAGTYGINAKEYTQAPFKEVKSEDRYQTRMNRGEVFIQGVRALEVESKKKFDKGFLSIEPNEQDTVLQMFEDNKVTLTGISASTFFALLRTMTIEGAYSDPLYGGNKDMAGWKMREYPGPRPAYINEIESEEFVKMDPISLTDYQP